ncbi:MAG: peptide chain release factor N(5)-glutamine methyltransferase [Verrucomicrobiota bacterium]
MKSVLEVLRATTEYFTKHGVESPRLNAEHLIAHALGKKRLDLYLEFDRPLGERELEPLRELVRKRAAGVPLQHLLGTVEFHGRTFISDARGLIPRPETELLMELILREPLPESPRVLDVGTGSGVIALTLAAELPAAQVSAVDASEDALSLARENAERLGLTGRVQLFKSNLLAGVEGAFDLIVANLPYIPAGEIASLSREVQHDPRLALDGGPIGTELINQLIGQAREHLNPGGRLVLEIGHDQALPLGAELERQNYRDIRPVADYQGVLRFLFASYG